MSTTIITSLTTDQVAALSTRTLAALNTEDWSVFTSEQVSALNSRQIAAITTDGLAALTTEALAGLETSDLVGLSTRQMRALTTDQVAALSSDQLSNLSSQQIADMAWTATASGWNDAQTIDQLVAAFNWETTTGGDMTAYRDSVKEIGANYLVQVSEETARSYAARIASGVRCSCSRASTVPTTRSCWGRCGKAARPSAGSPSSAMRPARRNSNRCTRPACVAYA